MDYISDGDADSEAGASFAFDHLGAAPLGAGENGARIVDRPNRR